MRSGLRALVYKKYISDVRHEIVKNIFLINLTLPCFFLAFTQKGRGNCAMAYLKYGVRSPKFIRAPCLQLYSLYPAFGLIYESAISQDRLHIFVTPCVMRSMTQSFGLLTDLWCIIPKPKSWTYNFVEGFLGIIFCEFSDLRFLHGFLKP